MGLDIAFEIPGPTVSTNAAYRSGRGRFWMNAEGSEFKDRITGFARRAMKGKKPTDADVSVSLDIWFKTRRNDLDGPIKLILDSLEGVIYSNDRQVVALHAYKHHHPSPVIRVSVTEVPDDATGT